MRVRSHSPEDTRHVAARFAQSLNPGDVVLLIGDLGAGKTTFVRGIAESLGVDERIVSSPTFTLMNVYPGAVPLIHVDFYRLPDTELFFFEELEEQMESGGVVVIEWGDRFLQQVCQMGSRRVVRIRLAMISDTEREVEIEEDPDY